MNFRAFLSVICCLFLVSGCSEKKTAEAETAGSKKLRVLATFAPIFSFTKNVAGDAAEVEMLLPPNTGPHDFSLAPSDLRKIASADVVVQNGFGLESWLDRVVQGGLKRGALRIVAAKGIQPMENPSELSANETKAPDAAAHEHKHEHEEGGPNPHVWLDPILAIKQVENIRDGLMARDPAHSEIYVTNANALITRLRNLDDEIGRATVGLSNKRLLTFHDSFAYFAARYGFEIVGVVEAFPGREPTPRYIQKLHELIVSKNVRVLFSEPQYSPQILRSLSEELKLPIAAIDPMETGEPSAGFYERVMRENLKSLTNALK